MKVKLSFISLILFFSACVETADPSLDEKSFLKIYDHPSFIQEFYPIDVQQTADDGFLILAGKRLTTGNFSGVFVLKTDKVGNVEQELDTFGDQLVHPLGKLIRQGEFFYFYAMSNGNQLAQLVKISAVPEVVSITPVGFTYPVAVAPDGDQTLLLSYSNFDQAMQIARVDLNGQVTAGPNTISIGVGDETEEPIINHFIQGGRKFPFTIGRTASGTIYYNGFYNYTFSLVFASTNANTNPSGVIYGQQDDGGISAIEPLGGNNFGLARFNFGDNYFAPKATASSSGITLAANVEGYKIPELVQNASVKILKLSNQPDVLVYASSTQSDQIALFAYQISTGKFLKSKYLGFSNPYQMGSVIETKDGGLAVLGLTYVAGRFPRLCLFKVSADNVRSLASGV